MGLLEKGSQLAIPFARAHRPRSATNFNEPTNILVTPQNARNEGAAGIYFCPVCGGRLDARVMGEIRIPYFAHSHGVGLTCTWRGSERDGSYGYVAQPRANWQQNQLGQIQRRNLTLEIRIRNGRAYLVARGSPTTLDSLGLDPPSISVQSSGTRQEVRLATVAMQRSEFSVAIADPLNAEISLKSLKSVFPRPVCQWRIDITPNEKSECCIVFLIGSDGVGRLASTLSEIPGDMQLLFRGVPNETGIVPVSEFEKIRTVVRSASVCIPVVDAEGWYVAQRPWDDEAREAAQSLGSKPLSVRRLLRVTPLSGVFYRGANTVIQPSDGKSSPSFWIRPSLVEDLSIEILSIPYGRTPSQSLILDQSGKILQMELEKGEEAGECYILALDPLDPNRIVEDIRMVVLSPETWKLETRALMENKETDGDWSTPLGVIIGKETEQVLSCVESPTCVATFDPNHSVPGIPSLQTTQLYGPADFLSHPEFLRTITLDKNGDSISMPRVLSTVHLTSIEELDYTLSLFASDTECTSVTIRFGVLGSIKLARYKTVAKASRASSRVRILAALIEKPHNGKHIGRNHIQLVLKASSLAGDHNWDSEVRQIWRAIRRGATSYDKGVLGLAYISTRGIDSEAFEVESTIKVSLEDNILNRVDDLRKLWISREHGRGA